MDPWQFSDGGRPSPTRRELQGPRPTPLKVNKDSYKFKKPPVAPQFQHQHHPPPPQQEAAAAQKRQPVVIYTVSPKVIHTTVSDFMNLVQRLTGRSPRARATETQTVAGNISPAARLASIEKASPSERDREREREKAAANDNDSIMEILQGTSAEMSQIPGILTPDPETLPPISPAGLFSPVLDSFLNGNMLMPSPSVLFSSPMVSPNSSFDLFFDSLFDF